MPYTIYMYYQVAIILHVTQQDSFSHLVAHSTALPGGHQIGLDQSLALLCPWFEADWQVSPATTKQGTRTGLNRRVPMGQSIQIMGGSFRPGLHSEVVIFSTRPAFQPSSLYKIYGRKARWQPIIFVSCLLIGPNWFILYSGPALWGRVIYRP